MSIWIESGSRRVFRGGGWIGVPQYARVANRGDDDPGRRGCRLGLRLVRRCT